MLLKFISDLHLEFCEPIEMNRIFQTIGTGDVLVLAGDLGDPFAQHYRELFTYVSRNFIKVFAICGNHEFYHHKVEKSDRKFAELCEEFNVVNMNRNVVEYKGVKFIGTPLWTYVSGSCKLQCDTKYIKDMSVTRRNNLHRNDFKFIQDNLASELPTIIMTHHLPSPILIQDQYKTPENTQLNEWFASPTIENLDFTGSNVKAWIYGHTHSPLTKTVNDIDTYCNPVGYPEEENELYISELTI